MGGELFLFSRRVFFFIYHLFMYWEKLSGSFLHWVYFLVMFIGFVFGKVICIQGGISSSRMPSAFRDIYILVGFGGISSFLILFAKIPLVVFVLFWLAIFVGVMFTSGEME